MDMVKAKSKVGEQGASPKSKRGRPPKRRKVISGSEGENETQENSAEETRFLQPAAITGGKLKDYQLDGVAWMVGLYENGISGILGVSRFAFFLRIIKLYLKNSL
jgi:ATP-dependent DNA helicase